MSDCDDYEDYDDLMDECLPDGSDAEDYQENWQAMTNVSLDIRGESQMKKQKRTEVNTPKIEKERARIERNKEKVDAIFYGDCVIEVIKDEDNSEIIAKGDIYYCLDSLIEYVSAEGNIRICLKCQRKIITAECVEKLLAHILAQVEKSIIDFENCFRLNEWPKFANVHIDEENLNELWAELNEISSEYKEGMDDFAVYSSYKNSLLLYRQAKYIEDVEWCGKPVDELIEIEEQIYNYSDLDKWQFRCYLYWRTCFRKGNFIKKNSILYSYLYANELLTYVVTQGDCTKELDYLKIINSEHNFFDMQSIDTLNLNKVEGNCFIDELVDSLKLVKFNFRDFSEEINNVYLENCQKFNTLNKNMKSHKKKYSHYTSYTDKLEIGNTFTNYEDHYMAVWDITEEYFVVQRYDPDRYPSKVNRFIGKKMRIDKNDMERYMTPGLYKGKEFDCTRAIIKKLTI